MYSRVSYCVEISKAGVINVACAQIRIYGEGRFLMLSLRMGDGSKNLLVLYDWNVWCMVVEFAKIIYINRGFVSERKAKLIHLWIFFL